MATIDIRRTYDATKTTKVEARKLAEKFMAKMQERFELDWAWKDDRLNFSSPRGKAKGTTGTFDVTENVLHIQIELPFLLRVFKGMLEGRLREGLDQVP